MSNQCGVLKNQLDLFANWKTDHVDAMKCRDLEDVVAQGNLIADLLQKNRSERTTTTAAILQIDSAGMWMEIAGHFIDLAGNFTALGYEVDGLDELKRNYQHFQSALKKASDIHRRLCDLRDGKGVSWDVVVKRIEGRVSGGSR